MSKEPTAISLDHEKDEYKRMLLALYLYKPRKDVADRIKKAYDSKEWRWQDCDGCTGVSEAHCPDGFKFWPCVMHDYDCDWWVAHASTWAERNRRRAIGDNRFYLANLDYGISRFRSKARWLGVRFYWNFWGKWKPLKSGVNSGRNCYRGL